MSFSFFQISFLNLYSLQLSSINSNLEQWVDYAVEMVSFHIMIFFLFHIYIYLLICLDSVTEENCTQSFIPMATEPIQTSPLDLSIKRPFFHPQRSSSPSERRARPTHTLTESMCLEDSFDSPKVFTQPKAEWHYRSLKDLQKKHLPYLAGIGPQRTPIRVTVSRCSSFRFLHFISVWSLGSFILWNTNLSWNICCYLR